MTPRAPKLLVATTSAVTPWGIMRGQLAFLARHGFDVVLTSSPGPLLDATAAREGVRVVPVPMSRPIDVRTDVTALRRLVGVLRRERPDVSVVSTPKAGLLAGIAAWITRVPVRVYLLRGLRLETTHGPTRALLWVLEWVALHVATHVVVVSPSLLAETRRRRLVGAGRGVVLGWGASNGVDTERLAPTADGGEQAAALRTAFDIPQDAFVFGFVGRLTADKGVAELGEAFPALAADVADAWLLVVGPTEPGPGDDRHVPALLAHPRVRATGWIDDPSDVYRALDALVLPTYREGFPNVVIEASAAGLPVVTTTATGAVDSVVDGVTGTLVPPHDAARLRAAMAAMAADPTHARALGQAGRAMVVERFSHEVVWGALLAFLGDLVPRRDETSRSTVSDRHTSLPARASRFASRQVRVLTAARKDPEGLRLARRIRADRLTYLQLPPLLDLRDVVRELDARGVPGSIIEAGCALGGSSIMLAAAKDPARPMTVHDVFGMIPPPTDRDGADVVERYQTIVDGGARGFDGDTYYGYRDDLKGNVARSFAEYGYPVESSGVTLVEGLFEDTVKPTGPVALIHIDGDWYESVKTCLDRVWPVLSVGGVMVIDDYDAWSGCRTAVDEFLVSHPECTVERRARLHLRRTTPPR